MSIDLANSALNTCVSCSCVCADSYECTNLINSTSQLLRRKGFQGERFVRVPVTIQFQFPIPANIHKVELLPCIGRQCAKIIQLLTSNSYPICSEVNDNEADWTDNMSFRRCASVALTENRRVTFLNRGYSPHPSLPTAIDDNNSTITFTSGDLSNITALRITIRQMLVGSVPSIADVRIWGRPAKSCSQAQKKKILRLSKQLCQLDSELPLASPMFYRSSLLGNANSDSGDNANIPEVPRNVSYDRKEESGQPSNNDRVPSSMLDPLTLEPMRFPILLPSGHSIDRSTLDKHVKSQSEYGNAASDPFTGIPFSDSHKPIPNAKLKSRIDEFNLNKPPEQTSAYNGPVHYIGHVPSGQNSLENSTAGVSDSNQCHIKVTKRTYASGHVGHPQHAASLDESLAEMSHSISKKRSLTSVNESSSTLMCCKCSCFMYSDTVRYTVPCRRVICGKCIKDIHECIVCPCLMTHELKSIRRTYRE